MGVSGVCTTVVALGDGWFSADLSSETLTRTTLASARSGMKVNLEPSLRAGAEIGGHFVAGHVDGVGTVTLWRRDGGGVVAEFRAPPEVAAYVVGKGSVAVDGVSLTPHSVECERFRVSLIPETLRATTLGALAIGRRVNLESDLIAKYVAKTGAQRAGVSLDLLARAGFLD